MKRCLCALLILQLLLCMSGCGEKTYIQVEPHNEDYEFNVDANAIVVSSYLSLKNAILDMIENGTEEGTIWAESYAGDLESDLKQVVYDTSRGDPLGAYAVDLMTYDYSKIVSYYEIQIQISFRHTAEEMASIVSVSSSGDIEHAVEDAMSGYDPTLLLMMEDYEDPDIPAMAAQVFREHPEFALEMPTVSVDVYPDSGRRRLLEIGFSYETPQEELLQDQQEAEETVARITKIYSTDDQQETIRRLYSRVSRSGTVVAQQEQLTPLVNSVYGALLEGYATSYGYAQTFCMMLSASGIDCALVDGTLNDQAHTWCAVKVNGVSYYMDPSPGGHEAGDLDCFKSRRDFQDLGYVFADE